MNNTSMNIPNAITLDRLMYGHVHLNIIVNDPKSVFSELPSIFPKLSS